MHLECERGSLGQLFGGACGKNGTEIARGVGDEESAANAVAGVLDAGRSLGDIDDDVMHDRVIARPCLDGLNPFVLVEVRRDQHILVRQHALDALGRHGDRVLAVRGEPNRARLRIGAIDRHDRSVAARDLVLELPRREVVQVELPPVVAFAEP